MLYIANQPAKNTLVDTIVFEVKKHGFYATNCESLLPNMRSNRALIRAIKLMAITANLSVSFNAQKTLCIFEAK